MLPRSRRTALETPNSYIPRFYRQNIEHMPMSSARCRILTQTLALKLSKSVDCTMYGVSVDCLRKLDSAMLRVPDLRLNIYSPNAFESYLYDFRLDQSAKCLTNTYFALYCVLSCAILPVDHFLPRYFRTATLHCMLEVNVFARSPNPLVGYLSPFPRHTTL